MEVKEKLVERIEAAIWNEMQRTGHMGTEDVTANIELTDEECDIFLNELSEEKYGMPHYYWELEKNGEYTNLCLIYTEELIYQQEEIEEEN